MFCQVDRRIQRILGDAPHMEHAGSDVALTISSGCLRISTLEGSTVVACHDMPNISFASGGDPVSFSSLNLILFNQICWLLSTRNRMIYRIHWISSPTWPKTMYMAELVTSSNAEVDWRRTSLQPSVKHSNCVSRNTSSERHVRLPLNPF